MNPTHVARIGVLVPLGNSIHECEFAALKPFAAVQFRFAGFSYPVADATDFCAALADQLIAPLSALRDWGAQLILIGCTTATMRCADPADHARLESFAGVPVVTAASAVRDALAACDLHRITVATPYGENGNGIIARYLQSLGVSVTALGGLNLDRTPEDWKREAPALTPQQMLDFSLGLDAEASQALYLPCTGVRSLATIELYEQRTGKLALSSVQAGFWACLQRLGIDGRQSGAGQLIARWPTARGNRV